jgi:hypothetical protein
MWNTEECLDFSVALHRWCFMIDQSAIKADVQNI